MSSVATTEEAFNLNSKLFKSNSGEGVNLHGDLASTLKKPNDGERNSPHAVDLNAYISNWKANEVVNIVPNEGLVTSGSKQMLHTVEDVMTPYQESLLNMYENQNQRNNSL